MRRRGKAWVRKPASFKEARAFDEEYYLSMTPAERLETMQFLREMHAKFHHGAEYEKNRKGLRRVVAFAEQARR